MLQFWTPTFKTFFFNQKLAFTQLAVKTKTPLYIFHHRNRTPTDLTPQQAGLRKRQAYRRPAAAKKKKTGSAEGGVKIDLLVDLFHRAKHCLLFISSDKNIMCEQLKTHASIWKNKTITKVDSKKKSICIIHKPDCKHARTCLNPRTQMHILQT